MASNPGSIPILLACPGTMASELYTHAFNRCPGFRVAARATTIAEALEAVRAKDIKLAIVSSSLKDGPCSGIMALQQIQAACPALKSVVLLERSEDHLVTSAFSAGAKGVFVPATDGVKMLCRCVRQVSAGQVWASSAQLHLLLDTYTKYAPLHVVNSEGARLLTKREEEVVQLVRDGLTNREIAKALQLSEYTVRNNLFRIFDKLGVSTRVELALYAVNHSKLLPFAEPRARKSVVAAASQKPHPAAVS
jgi:DNA-binding NarL/FixJ family response regulator